MYMSTRSSRRCVMPHGQFRAGVPRGWMCCNVNRMIYIFHNKWPEIGLYKLDSYLCPKPSFPPQLVPVTRITSCQPGVEGLDPKGNFSQDTTRSEW